MGKPVTINDIAKSLEPVKQDVSEVWRAPSHTSDSVYIVLVFNATGDIQCTCSGFHYRNRCKHVEAVRGLRESPT